MRTHRRRPAEDQIRERPNRGGAVAGQAVAGASAREAAMLDLQKAAGNRRVQELMGGRGPEPLRAVVQRDTVEGKPDRADATDRPPATSTTMVIRDMDIVVPIDAFHLEQPRGRLGEEGSREVTVELAAEALDPRLNEAAAKGRSLGTVVISTGSGLRITLEDVQISALQVGKTMASLRLNAASISAAPPK